MTSPAPRRRVLLLRALAVLLVAALLEAGALVALWVNDRAFPSAERRARKVRAALDAGGGSGATGAAPSLETLHPYLGFVYDPGADSPPLRALHGLPISRFGFVDDREPVLERRDDRFVVGLFGGSFAGWAFRDARQVLVERLGRDPRLAGREVVLTNLALGGYKQPQQLMALAYLQALGGHFDLVVNLDGFNEVVLPVLENLPKGVFLPYPRNWYLRTGEATPGPVLALIARVDALRRRRHLVGRCASLPLLRSSLSAHLAWRLADRALTRETGRAESELVRVETETRRYLATGPFRSAPGREAMLAGLAAVWRDSSLAMDRLARGDGGRYLHFLQPNQYLDGSKPLTAGERSRTVDEGSPYAAAVREGYPHLLAAGRELAAAGVEHHDLTRLFAAVEEPLYADACCHVDRQGSALVMEAIADAVLAGPLPAPGG